MVPFPHLREVPATTNHPYRFKGARKEVLQEWLDFFVEAEEYPGLWFWQEVFRDYWRNVSWRVPMNEELVPGAGGEDPGERLTRDELLRRDNVRKRTHKKIKSYFYYSKIRIRGERLTARLLMAENAALAARLATENTRLAALTATYKVLKAEAELEEGHQQS
ncbi:hypothetical protein C8R43DRAFT_1130468 [Mycena crocata]|nr:hypothetical protein C8R43DRAFT_964890 [Mycena crocata]KAJ7144750.1 hypothetical protein C8R43DRAFT_1130468 [Mycena crocata]